MKKIGGLENALKKYRQIKKQKVRVGIFESATYAQADKEPLHVAQVAYWNEYGAQIQVPEHQITVYRLVSEKTGDFRLNGRFVKQSKANFATTHTVPAHTINIPARSFFRKTVRTHKGEWIKALPGLVSQHGTVKGLELVGKAMKGNLVESIMTWTDPPNSKATIARKGKDAPLRDTVQMSRSIGVEVSDNDES